MDSKEPYQRPVKRPRDETTENAGCTTPSDSPSNLVRKTYTELYSECLQSAAECQQRVRDYTPAHPYSFTEFLPVFQHWLYAVKGEMLLDLQAEAARERFLCFAIEYNNERLPVDYYPRQCGGEKERQGSRGDPSAAQVGNMPPSVLSVARQPSYFTTYVWPRKEGVTSSVSEEAILAAVSQTTHNVYFQDLPKEERIARQDTMGMQ